jgi:predicted phosphate transport protein (TIGR00153 family)
MTRTSPFASLFGRSPFKALQEHMRAVKKCADQVPDLFEALCEGNQAKVEEVKNKIFQLEEEADGLKNELREHLPKSLFMPVDRRDLLEVLDLQDAIADTAKDMAGLLVERDMTVMAGMKEPLMALVRRSVEACEGASRIIETLDELVETGFRGRDSDEVMEMVGQLNKIEADTDRMGIELTRRLFSHEDDMKPVSVVFWYDLIKMIGDLADYAERVGNRLRLLLAR